MLSDQFLIANEYGMIEGPRWEGVFEKSIHFFSAPNIKEARLIAKEYGRRILKDRLLGVIAVEEVK